MTLRLIFAILSLTIFGSAVHSADTLAAETNKKKFEDLIAGDLAELPYRVQFQMDKPLQLIWKDGSKVAEIQTKIIPFKSIMPFNVSQNSCGNHSTGELCNFNVRADLRMMRLAWVKHPDPAKIGKPILVNGRAIDEDSNQISYLARDISEGNFDLLRPSAHNGPLFDLSCQDTNWLPPSINDSYKIETMTTDYDFNSRIIGFAKITTSELHDLTLRKSSPTRVHMDTPTNPFFSVGMRLFYDTPDFQYRQNEGGLITYSPTTWVMADGDDLCEIRYQLDETHLQNDFYKAREQVSKFQTPNLKDIFEMTSVPILNAEGKKLAISSFQLSMDNSGVEAFVPPELVGPIYVLSRLQLIKTKANGIVTFNGQGAPDESFVNNNVRFHGEAIE